MRKRAEGRRITRASAISRQPILAHRVRQIEGGFAFVEHRFLQQGFFALLSHEELVLYLLLILAADRQGISFHGAGSICSLCRLSPDEYALARNVLIAKDLIAYDGRRFQVLSLPQRPEPDRDHALIDDEDFTAHDPLTIRTLIRQALNMKDVEDKKDG